MKNVDVARGARLLVGLALAGVIVGSVPAATTSCTVFVDNNAHQCETTADCGAFPGSVCTDRHVCVLGPTACLDNNTCIDRHGSETYYCQKPQGQVAGECTQLITDQCKTILADPGDMRNDDVVILSSYFMPSWFPLLKGGVDATELVRRDFKTVAGGLPGIKGGKSRPVAFLVCDVPFGDQAQNRLVTDHIFKVGIQGSLGPILGDWMAYWLGKVAPLTLAGGSPPMSITTGNKFPGFEGIQGTKDLWFTVGIPSEGRAKAYAQVTKLWETKLREGGIARDVKVAFVSPGTAITFAVSKAYREVATYNGKAVAANDTAGAYKEFAWGDTSDVLDPNYVKAINETIAYNPDIVVCDGGTPCADFPKALEASGKGSNIRYIIGQEGQQAALIDAVGTNEAFRKRILGTHPGRAEDSEGQRLFVTRFLQNFNEPAEAQGFAGAAYDMAYEMMFAVAAVGEQPITGINIGKALQTRFKPGGFKFNTYEAGITIVKALQALQAGQNLDLNGAQHHAYFDETGQIDYEGQIWCISGDLTAANRFRDTGLSFGGSSADLRGANGCF